MKLCPDCRNKLRVLVLYILSLACIVALATGLVFQWNLLLTGGVFLAGMALGVCHIYCGSCRLCKLFHRHRARVFTHTT